MEPTTFEIEYRNEHSELTEPIRAKIEQRLQKLARGKKDITGASISVNADANVSPRAYSVRVVLTLRGGVITSTEKGPAVAQAVADALDAVERQVRDAREKRRDGWKRGGDEPLAADSLGDAEE